MSFVKDVFAILLSRGLTYDTRGSVPGLCVKCSVFTVTGYVDVSKLMV